jgi:hypothetical protein
MMNSSRTTATTPAFRPFNVTLAALALLMPALAAPARGDCPNVQVQAGNTLALRVYAVGVQTYRWSGMSWDPAGPEAVLYAEDGNHAVVGTHHASPAGPTRPVWESVSGSKVVGTVLERCNQDPDAIPWLLLGAVSSQGPGVFNQVTFIQRINTAGGKAPSVPGSAEGQMASVPYTAEYLFYKADK